jgi:hypothetical protein
MFFRRCEKIEIDGKVFELSNATNVETYNCKMQFMDVYNSIEFINEMDESNFTSKKKEMVAFLKEFDKKYIK